MAAKNFEEIGKAFIPHYYNTFDQNRQNVAGLYSDQSLMTWQGNKVQGKAGILNHLCNTVTFKKVKHNHSSIESQPSLSGGVVIVCCGSLYVDDEQYPLLYTDVFHLMQTGANSFVITNHIFTLNQG